MSQMNEIMVLRIIREYTVRFKLQVCGAPEHRVGQNVAGGKPQTSLSLRSTLSIVVIRHNHVVNRLMLMKDIIFIVHSSILQPPATNHQPPTATQPPTTSPSLMKSELKDAEHWNIGIVVIGHVKVI